MPGSDRPYSEMWVEGGGDADSLPPLTLFLHKEHYQSLQPGAGWMVQDTGERKQLTNGSFCHVSRKGVQDTESREPTDPPYVLEKLPTGLEDGHRQAAVKVEYLAPAEDMEDSARLLLESASVMKSRNMDCGVLLASDNEDHASVDKDSTHPCQMFCEGEVDVPTLQLLRKRGLTCVLVKGTKEETRVELKEVREKLDMELVLTKKSMEIQAAKNRKNEIVVNNDWRNLQNHQEELFNNIIEEFKEPEKQGSGIKEEDSYPEKECEGKQICLKRLLRTDANVGTCLLDNKIKRKQKALPSRTSMIFATASSVA